LTSPMCCAPMALQRQRSGLPGQEAHQQAANAAVIAGSNS